MLGEGTGNHYSIKTLLYILRKSLYKVYLFEQKSLLYPSAKKSSKITPVLSGYRKLQKLILKFPQILSSEQLAISWHVKATSTMEFSAAKHVNIDKGG